MKLSLASHDSFDSDGVSTKLSVSARQARRQVRFHRRRVVSQARHVLRRARRPGRPLRHAGRHHGLDAARHLRESRRRARAAAATGSDGQRLPARTRRRFHRVPGSRANGRLTTSIKGDPRATVGDPARNDATTVSVEYRNKNLFGGDAIIQAYTYDYWALFEGGALPTFALTAGGPGFLDQSAISARQSGRGS